MSEPHLIDYTLAFDPSSVRAAGPSPLLWIVAGVLLVAVAAGVLALGKRAGKKS